MCWQSLITLLGTVTAAVAAIAAWITACRVKKTVWAQIIMQITSEYSSKEMFQAIFDLANWKNKYETNYAEEYAKLLKARDPKGIRLHHQRRMCSHYYERIWKLINSKVLSLRKGSFVKKIIYVDQVDFYLNTIEPMERAINPKYDKKPFDGFRKMYKKELEDYRKK